MHRQKGYIKKKEPKMVPKVPNDPKMVTKTPEKKNREKFKKKSQIKNSF